MGGMRGSRLALDVASCNEKSTGWIRTWHTPVGCVFIPPSVLVGSAAHADVTLNSVRVAASNTVALAKFYQSAFGMQEVNRIDVP